MEQNLTLSGRVKLSRKELGMAVNDWLKSKNLKTKRLIYEIDKNALQGVVVDVYQDVKKGNVPDIGSKLEPETEEKERQTSSGWKRKNTGVFKYLRELFDDEKKKGTKAMAFADVYENVKFSFPAMNKKKLDVYLHDRRQLPGVKYSSKAKEINLNP